MFLLNSDKTLASPPFPYNIILHPHAPGANDASLKDCGSAKQHIPLPQYRRDMEAIVKHIQALSADTRILLIAPPPIDEPALVAHAQQKYNTTDTRPSRTNETSAASP